MTTKRGKPVVNPSKLKKPESQISTGSASNTVQNQNTQNVDAGKSDISESISSRGSTSVSREAVTFKLRTRGGGASELVEEGPSNSGGGASKLERTGLRRVFRTREKGPLNSTESQASFIRACLYICISFSEGHTPKGVGLRVADSLTGNNCKDDFMPLETFRGDALAEALFISTETYVYICDAHIYRCEALHVSRIVYDMMLFKEGCRLQQRLQAATKVAGCCEGRNKGWWLIRRLPQRLHTAMKAVTEAPVKATTELAGYCKGCHIGYNKGYWLLRRLPQRLQAAVKAATKGAVKATTKVAGCYEGCHTTKKAATPLRRLQRR
ncbi:hypothetical protein Tco_0507483 [Tanacetum coccineum]